MMGWGNGKVTFIVPHHAAIIFNQEKTEHLLAKIMPAKGKINCFLTLVVNFAWKFSIALKFTWQVIGLTFACV